MTPPLLPPWAGATVVPGADGRFRVATGALGLCGVYEPGEHRAAERLRRSLAARPLPLRALGVLPLRPSSHPLTERERRVAAAAEKARVDPLGVPDRTTYHAHGFTDGWRVWSPRLERFCGRYGTQTEALTAAHEFRREDLAGGIVDRGRQLLLFPMEAV